jgi:hypothetical protein
MNRIMLAVFLIAFSLLVCGCSAQTLAEKIAGTWVSIEFIDMKRPTEGAEIQLVIQKSGKVVLLLVWEEDGKKKREREQGEIEGIYLLTGEESGGKITIEGKHIRLDEAKGLGSVIFARVE